MEIIEVLPIRLRVTAILRKALLAGQFRPGEELSLTDIAARMGVSRTPVREAFQALAAEGLLELRMNKGAIVVGIDEQFMRALLECEAVRRAVQRDIRPVKLLELQDWAEAHMDTMTEEEYRSYNHRLHMEIWRAAGNRKLYDLLSSLWNGPSGGNIGRDSVHEALSIGEHRKMIDLMTTGKGEEAASIMAEHITRSMHNILRSFRLAQQRVGSQSNA